MCAAPTIDRRRHVRHPLPTSVEFLHESSAQNYVGRRVDLSDGGLLMYVPARVPIQVGDVVRLKARAGGQPELADSGEPPLKATIVRVDRHSLLTMGHVAVGVKFDKTDE